MGRQRKKFDVGGKLMTLPEIAEIAGISEGAAQKRIKRGKKGEEILSYNRKRGKLYTYNGCTMSLREWSEYLGIAYSTILARLKTSGGNLDVAFRRATKEHQAPIVKPKRTTLTKCEEKQSRCNYCDNARADRCIWVMLGKPVKGWKAEKTVIYNEHRYTDSYNVRECPNFVVGILEV